MTTFNYEWDATFEANPEDTDYFHFGALEIRDLKKAFRERFNVDHYIPVSYTHLRAHETVLDLVCRLLLEKKKTETKKTEIEK